MSHVFERDKWIEHRLAKNVASLSMTILADHCLAAHCVSKVPVCV